MMIFAKHLRAEIDSLRSRAAGYPASAQGPISALCLDAQEFAGAITDLERGIPVVVPERRERGPVAPSEFNSVIAQQLVDEGRRLTSLIGAVAKQLWYEPAGPARLLTTWSVRISVADHTAVAAPLNEAFPDLVLHSQVVEFAFRDVAAWARIAGPGTQFP